MTSSLVYARPIGTHVEQIWMEGERELLRMGQEGTVLVLRDLHVCEVGKGVPGKVRG